jgi:hypothetical protein
VLAGTDAGAFISDASGATWHASAGGLPKGQHIGAVALSDSNGGIALFAAADKLYRYPGTSTSTQALLARVAIFGALITVFLWISARQRRTMRRLTPTLPPELQQPGAPGRLGTTNRPRPTFARGGDGHIRGGPPPAAHPDEEDAHA